MASRKDDGRWSFGQEMWTSFSLAPRRRYRDLIEHKIWARLMESTKLMRWLWGEDQGGRIYLYEPQREVVGFTPPIAFTQRQDA